MASTCGTWSVVPGANPGSLNNVLYGATAISSNNIWAVGEYADYLSGHSYRTLTEQWNGTNWNVISSPNPVRYNNDLYGVAAVSSSDIWAVGMYNQANMFSSQTLIEHWNGRRWKIIPSPNPGQNFNDLYAVAAVSTTDAWAAGYYYNSSYKKLTLIEHWDGTSWSIVPSPNVGAKLVDILYSIASVPGSSTVWTVGNYAASGGRHPLHNTLTEFYC